MINAALLGIAGQVMGIVDLLETCFKSAVPDNFLFGITRVVTIQYV